MESHLFPQVLGPVQRAILKHSYYIVYFLQEEERSIVLAVLDGRMEPRAIQKRVAARSRTGQGRDFSDTTPKH